MKQIIIICIVFSFLSCKKENSEKRDNPLTVKFVKQNLDYNKSNGSIEVIIDNKIKYAKFYWLKYSTYGCYDTIFNQIKLQNLISGAYFFHMIFNDSILCQDTLFLASHDTIKPKQYLPVYPGSFWVYNQSDTDFVSRTYVKWGLCKIQRYYMFLNCNNISYLPDDSVYLPLLNGTPIFEYNYVQCSIIEYNFIPILSEEICDPIPLNIDMRNFYNVIQTVTKDTSIQIYNNTFDNVLIVLHGNTFGNSESIIYTEKYYYAKDIGLILQQKWDSDSLKWSDVRKLKSWKINISK